MKRNLFFTIILTPLNVFLWYLAFFNYTEPTELGIARDHITGKMWTQDGGIHITMPWVQVVCIDLRPLRVGVPSAGKGYSAKLVQFKANYWKEFVATEGFYYYWWANRFSFNGGYNGRYNDDEYRGMKDIMRGYAYSVKPYPFIEITKEFGSQ